VSNTIPSKTYATLTGKEKRIETTAALAGGRQLSLTTHKTFTGELVTRASVGIVDNGFVKYLMGHDYNRQFHREKVRVTAKNIQAQHYKYLADLDQIAEDATRYYGVSIVKIDA